MSEIVNCDICGKLFNSRFVNSHKRLAHRRRQGQDLAAMHGQDAMHAILSLYGNLSSEERQEVLELLVGQRAR